MNTIFIDECGYTGEDLLREDQPIFTTCSLMLDEEICLELKKKFFHPIQAYELKHSSMRKRTQQQKLIIEFINELKNNFKNKVFFSVSLKKFVLLTKYVDIIVETLTYDDGIDLYDRGCNIALSNLLFLYLPSIMGKQWFCLFLKYFQGMIRTKNYHDYIMFINLIKQIKNKEIQKLLFPILLWDRRKGFIGLNMIPSKSLDISMGILFTIVNHWTGKLKNSFYMIHDNSSVLANEKDKWIKVVNPDVENKIVGHDRRKFHFPLLLKEVCFEKSEEWSGIQLTDILAGAMARQCQWYANGRPNDQYAASLSEAFEDSFVTHAIWPSNSITPEELDATTENADDAIDFIVSLLKSPGPED